MSDRTGVFVGFPEEPVMQYEVERIEPRRRFLLGADFEIKHISMTPQDGLKGVIDFERERRGISRLEQTIFRRVRTDLKTGDR
jgi:hypothetical protein